jgi:cytochrome c
VGLLGSVAFSAQLFARASSIDAKSGEELYCTGCAACHGPDGTGTMAQDSSVVLARSTARVP